MHVLSDASGSSRQGADPRAPLLRYRRGGDPSQFAAFYDATVARVLARARQLAPDTGLIQGDVTQITQLLFNLATNARDSMPDGGELYIETRNVRFSKNGAARPPELGPGGYVHLRVADTGEGIPAEIVEHIFEPFFTTKEIGKGTGLGLAVVYGVVKSHNGQIYCSVPEEGGTVFDIYLPALESGLPATPPEEMTLGTD